MDIIVIAAVAVFSSLCLLLSVLALVKVRQSRLQVREQLGVLEGLKADLGALCAGAVGLDDRVAKAEQKCRRLQERQEQLELRDSGERLYAQAIRMAQNGAAVEELVTVCGLSRGEAELIAMMHREAREA